MMGSSTLAQPHAGLTRVAAWALAAVGGAGVVVPGAGIWGGAACAIEDAATVACNIAGVAAWALAAVLGACVVVSGAGVGVGAACAIEDAVGLAGHVAWERTSEWIQLRSLLSWVSTVHPKARTSLEV